MSQPADYEAFVGLVDETRLLFHRLRRTAETLHHRDALTAGQRGILQSLRRREALTVPDMARQRPVSRQHVQALVNELLAAGYVELTDNPAHKSSRLVRLTPAGQTLMGTVERRERRTIDQIDSLPAATEMQRAASVLRKLRDALAAAPSKSP